MQAMRAIDEATDNRTFASLMSAKSKSKRLERRKRKGYKVGNDNE
jgi:hypothetical protein